MRLCSEGLGNLESRFLSGTVVAANALVIAATVHPRRVYQFTASPPSQVYFITLISHAWVLVMAVGFLLYLLQLKDYHPIIARIQGAALCVQDLRSHSRAPARPWHSSGTGRRSNSCCGGGWCAGGQSPRCHRLASAKGLCISTTVMLRRVLGGAHFRSHGRRRTSWSPKLACKFRASCLCSVRRFCSRMGHMFPSRLMEPGAMAAQLLPELCIRETLHPGQMRNFLMLVTFVAPIIEATAESKSTGPFHSCATCY